MSITHQIAKHLREVHFGHNWTSVNFKEVLAGVSWEDATTKLYSFNTIARLVFHVNYYVVAILSVLNGAALTAKDSHSFDLPPINSGEDWEALLSKCWRDAESLATLIEQMEDAQLDDIFVDERYGSYYRNFHGVIEHAHYHLGQIVLIKKLRQATRDQELAFQ